MGLEQYNYLLRASMEMEVNLEPKTERLPVAPPYLLANIVLPTAAYDNMLLFKQLARVATELANDKFLWLAMCASIVYVPRCGIVDLFQEVFDSQTAPQSAEGG